MSLNSNEGEAIDLKEKELLEEVDPSTDTDNETFEIEVFLMKIYECICYFHFSITVLFS